MRVPADPVGYAVTPEEHAERALLLPLLKDAILLCVAAEIRLAIRMERDACAALLETEEATARAESEPENNGFAAALSWAAAAIRARGKA